MINFSELYKLYQQPKDVSKSSKFARIMEKINDSSVETLNVKGLRLLEATEEDRYISTTSIVPVETRKAH